MKISSDDLRAFIAVADTGGFRVAAERLNVSQPALTQRLRKLEEYLDVSLFDRDTRNVALTVIGRDLLPTARRLVHDYDGSMARLQDLIDHQSGMVCFAGLLTLGYGVLPDILAAFRQAYPNTRVRVLDDTALRVADRVKLGEAAFGIDMLWRDDGDLIVDPVIQEPYVAAFHKDRRGITSGPIKCADLGSLGAIAFGVDSGIGRQLKGVQQSIGWDIEVQHLGTMMGLLRADFGIGIVPYSVVYGQEHLDWRPITEPELSRSIGMVMRAGAELSPAEAALYDIAREKISTNYRADF
jgi:DNA-binding transcriptional LysR family regulator